MDNWNWDGVIEMIEDWFYQIDVESIGTQEYRGIAYFWNEKYKHVLRPISGEDKVKVHKALLEAGLDVSGESPEHDRIIFRETYTEKEVSNG